MSAKVHYIEHKTGCYDEPERIDEQAEGYAESHGMVELWYWYAYGDYCGGGVSIGRGSDGRWGVTDHGHCSCFGPFEDPPTWHDTLDALKKAEADNDAVCLFAVIGQRREAMQ